MEKSSHHISYRFLGGRDEAGLVLLNLFNPRHIWILCIRYQYDSLCHM